MEHTHAFAEAKAIVQLVLPHGWVGRINHLATERGINRSALIREAIKAIYFDKQAETEGSGVEITPITGNCGKGGDSTVECAQMQ